MKKIILALGIILFIIKPAYSEGEGGFAGLTLGTPGLININLGYYGDIFGIQGSMSGFYLLYAMLTDDSDNTGSAEEDTGLFIALFQLNLDAKIIEHDEIIVAASIAGGTITITDENDPDSDFTLFYAGPCVHVFFHNIYLELGAAYAKDFSAKFEEDKKHIIPFGQIGYMQFF